MISQEVMTGRSMVWFTETACPVMDNTMWHLLFLKAVTALNGNYFKPHK